METAFFGSEWEGRVVEGRFPLLQFLGGSGNCGSFLTVLPGLQEAAIQLTLADGAEADGCVAQWEFAITLSHPHLVKVFAAGRCVIDRSDLVYVVTERSSPTLSKIIEDGVLKADAAREIFTPILNALFYIHGNGVVHGHVNPSSIQLADLVPKLSMTDLLMAGSVKRSIFVPGKYDAPELRHGEVTAAADTWSVGMTLWEAMSRVPTSWEPSGSEEPKVPESLSGPFREIVQDCLRLDPLQRCTIQTILERLDESKSISLSEVPIPVKTDNPLNAAAPIPASEIPAPDEPETHSLKEEKIGSEEVPEPVLFSRSLTHFEEAHASRVWVVPYAIAVLVVVALIAFLLMRMNEKTPSAVVNQNAPAVSPSPPPEQSTAPAPPAANPTEPESSQTESKTQPAVAPQTETQSATVPKQPAPEPSHTANHRRAAGETKGTVIKRVLPAISPGARRGMRRPVDVLIRVSVNREGTVSDAAYVWPDSGNYFARLAQRAAQSWEFRAPTRNGDPEPSVWSLHFHFGREKTDVTASEKTK